MPNRIILKRSSVAAKVPLAADLSAGELAINLADKRLFSKDGAGNVINVTVDATHVTSGTLPAARLPAFSGDATSTAGTSALTLANSGVTAGTYTKVTVDSKGRVTVGASLASADLPTYTGTITSSQVTTALGFTPYSSANPNGYTSNVGTVTSVSGTGSVSGLTLTGSVTTSGSLTLGGTLSLTSANVTTALGFTPYNNTNPNGYITSSGSISGNAGTATTLQTARTINGTSFNGSANIDTTEWVHSDRDFPNGTLITTNINYGVTNGDPWVLEIRGNSYGNIIPLDLLVQGYIYADTIINYGGISNGYPISGLVAINVSGNLCFWFPSQGYWNGYNVKVYSAYATRATNRVTSITGVAKPTSTKEVALSSSIRQALHSSNYTSYSPSLTGSGASGTWGINITGSAASITGTYSGSLTSSQVTTALGFTPYNATNPNGYTSNTGTVTSVSGTGTVSGLTLTGSVTTSGSLTLGGTLSAGIANISDLHRLFNNFGDNHGARTSFDATSPSYNFGFRYIQGSTNGPGVNSASQYYSLYVGLGNDYPATGAGSYGMMIAVPRNVSTPYLAVRYNESNTLGSWQKISAGYADTAGSAGTVTNGVYTTGTYADPAWITSLAKSKVGLGNVENTALSTWAGSANITTLGTIASGTVPVARVSGLATSATTDTTNAANISSGTLPSARLTGTYAISVSGNAATATTTDNINGRAFLNRDSGNVLGQDSYTTNGVGYVNGTSLFSQSDGGLYASAYSTSWVHQIYGDFRTGQIAVRGKNSGTWQAWRVVLDQTNYSSYALPLTGGTVSGVTTFSSNTTFNASPTVNAYLNCSQWFNITGGAGYGLYGNGTNGAHFYLNSGSYGPWKILGSRNGWSGLEFGGLSNGDVTMMIGTASSTSGFYNTSYGWQFYWGGGTIWMSTASYGGGTLYAVLNSNNWGVYIGASSLGLGSGNNVTFNSVSDAIGNLRTIVQNSQSAAYTLVATDSGKHISITTGGVTVPSGVFSAGQAITIYNNSGSNQTITQGSSVTMYLGGTATTGNRTLAQRGVVTVLCVASNVFVISGAGLT